MIKIWTQTLPAEVEDIWALISERATRPAQSEQAEIFFACNNDGTSGFVSLPYAQRVYKLGPGFQSTRFREGIHAPTGAAIFLAHDGDGSCYYGKISRTD